MYTSEGTSAPKPLSDTAFRVEEKRYKLYRTDPRQVRKGKAQPPPATDFSDVVDARDIDGNTAANRRMLHVHTVPASTPGDLFRPSTSITAVTFDGVPGLTILPNLLTDAAQRRLCVQSLTEFVRPPYPNNMSALDPAYVAKDGYEPRLRWATLGYAYDWTSRTYKGERERVPFPDSIAAAVRHVVALLPSVDASLRPVADGYDAQTAIVNFYPVGTSMMAHQDLSEACLHRPLVSISLGCSSVFLMGTESRDDRPHAFWLRSGDVAVFTGPSRLAYHAVPRILDDTPRHLLPSDPSDTETTDAAALAKMAGLRVNINVRQVYDAQHPAPAAACRKDAEQGGS